jgi:biopolymer transport protein ExbD
MSVNTIPDTSRARASAGRPSVWSAGAAPIIIKWAALRAPEPLRERLAEEWLAHLSELRRTGARFRFLFGCVWAAAMITYENPPVGASSLASSGVVHKGMVSTGRPRRSVALARRVSPVDGSLLSEINTTPLLDVMLVLLVTLIVSLPTLTHAVKLDLPRGVSSPAVPPTVIDLDIDSDGTIVWNGTRLAGLPQLESYLQAQAHADSQAEIHLRPERRAKYDLVAKVLALAQRNHMERVAFVNTTEFAN